MKEKRASSDDPRSVRFPKRRSETIIEIPSGDSGGIQSQGLPGAIKALKGSLKEGRKGKEELGVGR